MEKVLSSNGVNLCKVEIIELCADVRDGTTYVHNDSFVHIFSCLLLHAAHTGNDGVAVREVPGRRRI